MFSQRLTKRLRHLRKFAAKWPTDAFRIYDRDIPEYPWAIDLYADHVLLQHFETRRSEGQEAEIPALVAELLDLPATHMHTKTRRRRPGTQHEKLGSKAQEFSVQEGPHRLLVNLDDYIDTGLFLDHRNLRREVAKAVQNHPSQKPELLNLFCYTGAFSVWAASAGAQVTSVDMSNTYLDWAVRNFELNELNPEHHTFERADAIRWLPVQRTPAVYDIVVLDPPTWSRSKKMDTEFDVQRDHIFLIKHALRLLRPGGTLFFSTNLKTFKMSPDAPSHKELSSWSVPEDFAKGIHRSFRFDK